jgi:hypothetical protein
MLTVFANFKIDTQERFRRLKDSFFSFKDCKIDNWLINIRGDLKEDVAKFLKDNIITNDIQIFHFESSAGWISDTYDIISKIKSDYVLFWIEDHILTEKPEVLDNIVSEMRYNSIDHLHYSWFHFGKNLNIFSLSSYYESKNLLFKFLSFRTNIFWQILSKFRFGNYNYLVSCCSISKTDYLIKILTCKSPYVKRWPKETPFDFEKRYFDFDVLPAKIAIPKNELFVSIDDDHGEVGYSLISRGKYYRREERGLTSPIKLHKIKIIRKITSLFYYLFIFIRESCNIVISIFFYFKNKLNF